MLISMNNLLFSFDKEIVNPTSNAGKVWRIFIRNGTISVGDSIKITSVNLSCSSKAEFFTVVADVKSLHEELDVEIEGKKELSVASKGTIVGIDLKNCYVGRKKIYKKDIIITKLSIGYSITESLDFKNKFFVRFADAKKVLEIIKKEQEILLIWFGKTITAKITDFNYFSEGILIELSYKKNLAIPFDSKFKNDEVIKRIVLRAESKGKARYISGLFDFDYFNDNRKI